MTCKNCYHYPVCLPRVAVGGDKICESFKDKSRIVELPCKVGETVHYITYYKNKYDYHYIINASLDVLFQLFHEKEIGYVVFMTDEKSKSEAKLKELSEK